MKSNEKFSMKEFVGIIIFTVAIKMTDGQASLFFDDSANATWLVPFLSLTFILPSLLVLLAVFKHYPNLGLVEVVRKRGGQTAGTIIGVMIFLLLIEKSVSFSRSYVNLIHTMYYPKTPVIVSYLFFMLIGWFLAKRGLYAIGRTTWLYTIPLKSAVLFLVIMTLVFLHPDPDQLFPIFGPGLPHLVKDGFMHVSYLEELVLFSILFHYVKDFQTVKKSIIVGGLIAVCEIALFYTLYITVFNYPTVEKLTFPFHELTKRLSIGQFLPNIDAFYFLVWVSASFIRIAVYLYLSVHVFGEAFKIEKFELLTMPMAAVILLLGLIPENEVVVYRFLTGEMMTIVDSIFVIILPLFLWGLHRFGKDKGRSMS